MLPKLREALSVGCQRSVILALIWYASIAGCDAPTRLPPYTLPQTITMQETNEFAKTVERIGKDVKRLSVPDELFASKDFVSIYERPQASIAAAVAAIRGSDLNAHHKKIIGYAMQRLPPEQFLAFISSMADSVERGVTDMEVLETTAFPPLNWGRQSLVRHYQAAPVGAFLARLSNMPQVPEFRRQYIKGKMLTGTARRDYTIYREKLRFSHVEP